MGRASQIYLQEQGLLRQYNINPKETGAVKFIYHGGAGGERSAIGIEGYGYAPETALRDISISEKIAQFQQYHEKIQGIVESATGEKREPTISEWKGQEPLLPRAGGVQYVSTPQGYMTTGDYVKSWQEPKVITPKTIQPTEQQRTFQSSITGSAIGTGKDYFRDFDYNQNIRGLYGEGISKVKVTTGFGDLSLAGSYSYDKNEIFINKLFPFGKEGTKAHEYGHAISKGWDFFDFKESSKSFNDIFTNQDYPTKRQLEREYIARSFEKYMAEPSGFKAKYPKAASKFEDALGYGKQDVVSNINAVNLAASKYQPVAGSPSDILNVQVAQPQKLQGITGFAIASTQPQITTFGITGGNLITGLSIIKEKTEPIIKEVSMFAYPRYYPVLTEGEISGIKAKTPTIFEPYALSRASRLKYESLGIELESLGGIIEAKIARGIEPTGLISQYQEKYYTYEIGRKGEVTALTRPFGKVPFRETATGLGIKARKVTYKYLPEISTEAFTQTSLGLSRLMYGEKISKKIQPFTEFGAGTVSGYYGELRERPSKFLATMGITALSIPILKGVGGLGTAISPTATKVIGITGGAIMTGTYGWSIGERIYAAKTPVEKGKVTGGILGGEITPMLLGGYAALEIAPRVSGQAKKLVYSARGLPELKFIPEAFEVEVISKGKQFPTATPSKHLQIFKEQKYALQRVTKLEGYTGKGEIVSPFEYKYEPFNVPKGAWHIGEFKGGIISAGERPTEWKGLFVAPQPSLYFLRATPESYTPYSFNLFPEYGGKAGALWLEPLKFKGLPRQWRGKAPKFAETFAKKGTAYVLGQKAEIEAGISVGTQVNKMRTAGFFMYKGRIVPVISMNVLKKGLPVKSNLPTLGDISYSYRGISSRLPLTTPLSYAISSKVSIAPSYKYYKLSLSSYIPSSKDYRISYAPKSYMPYVPYNPRSYKPYEPYAPKSYVPYKPYTPKSYKPYEPYAPKSYIPRTPPYYPPMKPPRYPPRYPPIFALPKFSFGGIKIDFQLKPQRKRYIPSLYAFEFGIRGRQPKGLTGLEVRPLSFGRRRRK